MRYIVVGAGAIGGAIGALLTHAGADVTFVARGRHAEAIRTSGLELRMPDATITARTSTTIAIEDLELTPDDVILLAVKSQDTRAALASLSGLVVGKHSSARDLPLVCLQNGVDNERDASRLFGDVHGACVYMVATHLRPGTVEVSSLPPRATIEVGRYPWGSDEIDELLVRDLHRAEMSAVVSPDVMAWKRRKLYMNLANALEVIFGVERDEIATARFQHVLALAQAEAEHVFADSATVVPLDQWETRHAQAADGQAAYHGGSTWQSIARGSGTVETDFLNGEIVLLGRQRGIDTPINRAIQSAMAAALSGSAAALPDPEWAWRYIVPLLKEHRAPSRSDE